MRWRRYIQGICTLGIEVFSPPLFFQTEEQLILFLDECILRHSKILCSIGLEVPIG